MENQYDVGIANRYALFLEEGENSLTAIKKKLSKELRQKNKAIKKENAEAKKAEVTKTPEKPPKPEPKPVNDVLPVEKEVKEVKPEPPKNKEKKPNDGNVNKKEKEPSDKPRNYTKNSDAPVVENENVEKDSSKSNDNPPRKNFENRKPRERRNENDPNQPKPFNNHYRKNKDDWGDNTGTGDNTTDRYQNDENRIVNGFTSYNNDYRPRGGGRGRGGNRGGRGSYNGSERRRDYDQRNESKPENDAFKTDSWGDEKPENSIENTDNQKDDEPKATENDDSANEQKEVKEYLTLDEWKKLQGQRQKPQYNLRKAGEGEDLTQWKNMRELQKKKDEGFLENGRPHEKNNDHEKENTGNENVQRVMRQKHIDINVHFRESSVRGRGGRIIRSNRFGYKNRNEGERNDTYGGETRPFRKNREGFNPTGRGAVRQNAPKINDEHAFPSLG